MKLTWALVILGWAIVLLSAQTENQIIGLSYFAGVAILLTFRYLYQTKNDRGIS